MILIAPFVFVMLLLIYRVYMFQAAVINDYEQVKKEYSIKGMDEVGP